MLFYDENSFDNRKGILLYDKHQFFMYVFYNKLGFTWNPFLILNFLEIR